MSGIHTTKEIEEKLAALKKAWDERRGKPDPRTVYDALCGKCGQGGGTMRRVPGDKDTPRGWYHVSCPAPKTKGAA